jgi:hypothetical protein
MLFVAEGPGRAARIAAFFAAANRAFGALPYSSAKSKRRDESRALIITGAPS